MVARSTRLQAARPSQIGGKRSADRAAPRLCPQKRPVIHRLEMEALIMVGKKLLNFRHWRSCAGGKHQFVRFIKGHARKAGYIQHMPCFHRTANAALGTMADNFQRRGACQGGLHHFQHTRLVLQFQYICIAHFQNHRSKTG